VTADEADRRRSGWVQPVPSAGAPTNLLACSAPGVGVRVLNSRVVAMKFEARLLDQVLAEECLRTSPVRRALDLIERLDHPRIVVETRGRRRCADRGMC